MTKIKTCISLEPEIYALLDALATRTGQRKCDIVTEALQLLDRPRTIASSDETTANIHPSVTVEYPIPRVQRKEDF